jgi:hypothetical protein
MHPSNVSFPIRITSGLKRSLDFVWREYQKFHQRNLNMKNGVFWVVTPCGSCKNRRVGGTWRLLHQGDKIGELGTTQAATSNRRTQQHNNPEDTILYRTPVSSTILVVFSFLNSSFKNKNASMTFLPQSMPVTCILCTFQSISCYQKM